MTEGVAVEELKSPLEDAEQTAEDTENDIANHATNTTVVKGLLTSDRAQLSEELDDGDKQASQADGTEAVSESASGRTACSVLGEVVDAKVPGTVDTRDDGVDCVLEPFRNPVRCERDKHGQSNNLALATTRAVCTAIRIVWRWLPLDVDGNQCDGEPGGKCCGQQTADQADEVDMAILLADLDAGLEHQR